ncbi:MAG: hypothetical protein ACRD1R_20875 [Acidobacteriota bacterium]
MRSLTFILISLCFCQVASAQCYSDTGKHTCFEYTNLNSRMEFLDQHPQIGWVVNDVAGAYVNPNTGTSGKIYVRTSLIADDPNFVYEPNCENKNASGQCIGLKLGEQ